MRPVDLWECYDKARFDLSDAYSRINSLVEELTKITENRDHWLDKYNKQCAELDLSKRNNGVLEATVARLKENIERNREKLNNCDKNRDWCDDASNYLGPKAKESVQALDKVREWLDQVSKAYHEVGQDYPWDSRD